MKGPVRLLRRIAVTAAGTVLLVLGAVLLVAPGPGLLVILLALVLFATEYEWARRHLAAVRTRAWAAASTVAASPLASAATVLFGAGALALGAVLIWTDLLPVSGAGVGSGVIVAGVTVLATLAYSWWALRHDGMAATGRRARPGRRGGSTR